MAVISIVGTSGVGKSFLVRQLACLACMPALFEGEDGTFPSWLLKNVVSGKDPAPRYRYFLTRYTTNLVRARSISDQGFDCYVDGAAVSAEAIIRYAPKAEQELWLPAILKLRPYEADAIVLLTASPAFLKRKIMARGRVAETNAAALKRAIAIQDCFLQTVKGRKDVLVIDRTRLDFSDEKDLARVAKRADTFAKRIAAFAKRRH